MALEDLQSQYGPYNKKGSKGTGEVFDTLAFENANGLASNFNNSKYAGTEKIGKKPSGPDTLGNIPAERSYE
tara:strand:- start:131 stop:346 length:216 start_codon:yes stop_codon:yes gene_type:complete